MEFTNQFSNCGENTVINCPKSICFLTTLNIFYIYCTLRTVKGLFCVCALLAAHWHYIQWKMEKFCKTLPPPPSRCKVI